MEFDREDVEPGSKCKNKFSCLHHGTCVKIFNGMIRKYMIRYNSIIRGDKREENLKRQPVVVAHLNGSGS